MSIIGLILGMAAGIYGLRLAGFLLADARIPETWEHALTYLSVAILTALVVSSLSGSGDETSIRLLAAAGAAVLARATGKPWICIFGGMALYALLRIAGI